MKVKFIIIAIVIAILLVFSWVILHKNDFEIVDDILIINKINSNSTCYKNLLCVANLDGTYYVNIVDSGKIYSTFDAYTNNNELVFNQITGDGLSIEKHLKYIKITNKDKIKYLVYKYAEDDIDKAILRVELK